MDTLGFYCMQSILRKFQNIASYNWQRSTMRKMTGISSYLYTIIANEQKREDPHIYL